MSALGGGLNRSTQHFILKRKDGVYGDASRIFRGFRRERDLSVYSQAYLNKVACQLNERPRPRDSKPQQRFNASVASTGLAGNPERTCHRCSPINYLTGLNFVTTCLPNYIPPN